MKRWVFLILSLLAAARGIPALEVDVE